MKDLAVYVDQEGVVTFVHDDELMKCLRGLGNVRVRRASAVEPCPNDNSRWVVDMSPICGHEKILGPYDSRRVALAAEAVWLDWWLACERRTNSIEEVTRAQVAAGHRGVRTPDCDCRGLEG